ncbi:hypothetical protein LSTR_LSTR006573 [Laodelphax striatellus]|uniref:Circadian clock-controlled protein n=1 Tax=Laodelphax striatellus TaxID=195883 RepID=A0A482WUH6_LAOST|nr:hypothetical protein LSTR_LSTR006573 [Laodelphax striatellus]
MQCFIINTVIFVNLCCFLGVFVSSKKIPDYVPVCKKSNPQFEKCILDAIEVVRPHLSKGIAKMKIPPSEPLVIPMLEVVRDLESLRVNAKLKDLKVYGVTSFVVKKLKVDLAKLAVYLMIPNMYVTAEYDVDGRLLVVPLRGKGLFKGNFTNSEADIKGTAKTITNKKGTEFLQIKDIKAKIRVGDSAIKFNNQDRENAAITETAANFINQNKKEVLRIISPIVEEISEAFIVQFGNAIFRAVPMAEMLPE